MALLFAYKTLKSAGLDKKLLGHEVDVLSTSAELKGYRECNEGEEYHTINVDPQCVVIGSLISVSDEDLQKLDTWENEYNRIQVDINGASAFAYQMKEEYLREQSTQEVDNSKEEEPDVLALAMERFESCKQNDIQKEEYDEDIKFKFGDQWRLDVAQDRQNDKRPMLTVNRCESFTNIVVNEGLQNRPAIKVRPNDDMTDPVTADVIAGLIRHIIGQPEAKIATDTAYEGAVSGGMGFIRVTTDYCDDTSFDQEIAVERIENPCTVYFPDHLIKKQDYSDAPYCFIRQKMSKKEFEEKYPDITGGSGGEFPPAGIGDQTWIEKDDIYLAEYFTVENQMSMIYLLPSDANHQSPYISNTIPDGIVPVRERNVEKKTVKWYLMTKGKILESKNFPGSRIPIIPVFGKEMVINGRKHFISLIRYMREVQRMFNYLWTAFIETVQNAPKAPFIVEYSQISKYKKYWDTANTKNWPYLPYKAKAENGQPLPPPQRNAPPEAGQSIITGLQYASEFMKDITGLHDASFGATSNERTGKAIDARSRQGNLSTYHYMNNYCNSMLSLANLLIDLIPIIYDTPRAIRIVGEDMADKVVLVNRIHSDPENPNRLYDLKTGKYSVIVTIGPSYDTRRMETADMLSRLMQTAPQLTMIFFDILARVMDMPGGQEIAARAKRFINQQYPGVIDDEELGTPEDQLRNQVQQMTQDIQKMMQKSQLDEQQKAQLTQMVQVLNTALKSKDDEIQAKVHIAHVKADTEITKAKMDLMEQQMSLIHDRQKHAVDTAVQLHQKASSENNNTGNQPAGYAEP
jgi:Phage P22-like portal protein/Gamma-glutamyl cyclotransferase, AIG2-like